MDILVASNNKHKIDEFRKILSKYGINVFSPESLGIKSNPIENGKTYEENSLIKANALKQFTKMPIIADDSGLNIKALNNFPGIYSSRFADENGGNKSANKKIIELLRHHEDKSAEFICVITLLNFEKEPIFFRGICKGKILEKPDGDNGFGYDPIFYSNEAKCSFGTCSEEIKNKYSHRAKAINLLLNYLKKTNL